MRPQTYVSGTIIFLHLYVWFKYQVHKISIIQITHDHWIPWHERGRKTCLFWRSKSKRYRSWWYNCPFTVIMETETIEYCAKCLFYVITLGSMHLAMYSILAKWHFSFHKNYCFSIHKTFLLLNTLYLIMVLRWSSMIMHGCINLQFFVIKFCTFSKL